MHRRRGVPAAEIDLVPEQPRLRRLGVPFDPLVADFPAEVHHLAKRKADAAEDHGAVGRAIGEVATATGPDAVTQASGAPSDTAVVAA